MKRFIKRLALGFILALPWIGAVSAQQVNMYCVVNPASPPYQWTPCQTSSPLPTTSVSLNGIAQGVSAPGAAARVAQEPTQLFWDDFGTGTLDTTAKWTSPTTGGGGNATAASSAVSFTALGSGTTAGGWSLLSSQFSFPGKNPSWTFLQEQNNFEFPVLLNAVRFWGFATFPAAPTAAAPYADAVGFELGTDGHLRAVMSASAGSLAAGTKTVIADLSVACTSANPYGGPLGTGTTTSGCAAGLVGKVAQPQDNGVHKYIIYFRGDNTYWAIDGIDNIVAFTVTGAQGPNVNTLPVAHAAIANTGTGPTSTALLTVNQVTVGDTGRNEIRICDPTNPWRCAAVSAAGALSTSANLAGTTSNASSAVATSSTNIPAVSYLYGFNGTTWDQLQVDASKNLKVLDATGAFIQAPVAPATATATKSVLLGAQATTGAVNPTNGQQGALSTDTNNNLLVSSGGAANLATAQVSVTTGNITAASARALRRAITITNVTGTGPVYCGNTGVTTGTGTYLAGSAGSSITLNTTAAVFCTVAATTQTVTVAETY
jgi:hypothetical protein